MKTIMAVFLSLVTTSLLAQQNFDIPPGLNDLVTPGIGFLPGRDFTPGVDFTTPVTGSTPGPSFTPATQINIAASDIPESPIFALLGLGMAGLLIMRKRKIKTS